MQVASARRPLMFCGLFVALLVPLSLRSAVTSTQPILEIHADALTTYLHASATNVQDIRPQVGQRGVNLDGSYRAGPSQLMQIAGNPFENVWSAATTNGVQLNTGAYGAQDVDIALPAEGFSWIIGRSYNSAQVTSTPAHRDSNGYQGRNWFQNSQPEILLFEHATDDDKDIVYLVYGADRFIELKRVDIVEGTSDTLKATNGAAGIMLYEEGATNEPDTYTLIDQHSNEIVFFGFDNDAGAAAGQIWKITDPDGNCGYVGDATTGSTAISNGFNNSGYITAAYDTSDRRYTYTYTTLDSVDRLTEVKAETKTGGTWSSPTGLATVAEVDYSYYSNETYGDAGDLKLVEITTPLTDSGVSVESKKYYRYWEGSYDADANPGHVHAIQYIVDFEGTRQQDWVDETWDEDFLTSTESNLKPYSAAYFEYDSSHRIDLAWFNGECGCGGASNGTHEYTYEANGSFSDDTGAYDEEWKTRTVVERPDVTYVTQYFDEAHQGLSRVVTDADPAVGTPDRWLTAVTRDSNGHVSTIYTPATASSYTHSTGASTHSSTAGLIYAYTRAGSGIAKGFVTAKKWQKGTSGTAYYDREWLYMSAELTSWGGTSLDEEIVRPLIDEGYHYDVESTSTSDRITTDYTPNIHSSTLTLSDNKITYADVEAVEYGSAAPTTKTPYYLENATKYFEEAEDGIIAYWGYTSGRLSTLIEDADTGETGSGEDFENVTIPGGLSSTAGALHRKTTYTYDAQGRLDTTTLPSGRVLKNYYSKLADGRLVALSYTKYETSPSTKFYGPVSYTVRNHAGKTVVQATVGLASNESSTALTGHVDETDDDPITAMDLGSVVRLSTNIYDDTGTTLEEIRLYHDVPASGAGSDGTNYDPTLYGYDTMGRRWRTKEAHGTIYRTVYNDLGRVESKWIGTNDYSFTDGEASGTDNMVKTEETEYDGRNDDGNGYVTKRTLFVEDSTTDKRETSYTNDVRGRVLLGTRPEKPHAFHKYDNGGRRIATALYSSTASIDTSTDDPTTETTNRLALNQTHYNDKGQVFKRTRHKIDDSDGSDDANLESVYTYDEVGRLCKEEGEQLVKTRYDRLGRVTHRFILASDNDSSYSDDLGIGGDTVLEEHQTVYESNSNNVLLRVAVSRHPGSSDTGALDTNADSDDLAVTSGNLDGRAQITAMWYDDLDRLDDQVHYGNYGGSTSDRDGLSVPSRSDTALRTTFDYDTAGSVEKVTDPRGLVTYSEFDDAGRRSKEVRNYDSSVNSGNPSGTDDNQTVTYTYTDGLLTVLTADLPSGSTDQVTSYTYGTTKGVSAGDSKIATGHLLQETEYPDSASASDVVTYAYNAQSQEIYRKDQAGNEIETDYDDAGKEEHRKVRTLASGFDGRVRRISTTYTDLGQRQLVTQYDNAVVGSGSVVDEVKYNYDDWGNVEKYEQDKNSAVGASGSVDDYEVSYAYETATDGRNTLRRTAKTLPSGNVLTYRYSGDDDDASRVTDILDGEVVLCEYEYMGSGAVVGTIYPQPQIEALLHDGSSPPDYETLDRFNRVTTSRWGNDLGTPNYFYETDVTYDRNSNVTLTEDDVHPGFDVEYSIDDLDRLVHADQGTWGGSSISSSTHDQIWTLDQVGNWDVVQLDLTDDGDFVDTDEYDDDRTHNDVNELTARDIDDDDTDDYTLTYDAVGNLTDDDEDWEYEYDPFGRLRKVNNQSQALVAEYYYNGLGHMTAVHEDTDTDGDVDANDKWYYPAYDEAWRLVAYFREGDSDPKEEFHNHMAGASGYGRSSYINGVILRDRDGNTAWTDESDGVLEQRNYYCQNWRGDVVAFVNKLRTQVEAVRYTAYGRPFGIPGGDADSDGDRDAADVTQFDAWINASAYDVRGDVDLDGDVDAADKNLAIAYGAVTMGWDTPSWVGNRKGLEASEQSPTQLLLMREGGLTGELGRWLRRGQARRTTTGAQNLYMADLQRPVEGPHWPSQTWKRIPKYKPSGPAGPKVDSGETAGLQLIGPPGGPTVTITNPPPVISLYCGGSSWGRSQVSMGFPCGGVGPVAAAICLHLAETFINDVTPTCDRQCWTGRYCGYRYYLVDAIPSTMTLVSYERWTCQCDIAVDWDVECNDCPRFPFEIFLLP